MGVSGGNFATNVESLGADPIWTGDLVVLDLVGLRDDIFQADIGVVQSAGVSAHYDAETPAGKRSSGLDGRHLECLRDIGGLR